jgi:hypothetical protein
MMLTLTLIASAALEETIVDLMLGHEATARAGFTTRDVRGHGEATKYHSMVEQIRGHARQVEITVTAAESEIRSLLGLLRGEVAKRHVHYRIAPVTEVGQFD